jgi:hypothetical protein
MEDLKELVSPLPKSEVKKVKSLFALHKGRVVVRCKECDQLELVDDRAFHTNIGHWYALGLHPRFSPVAALKMTGQTRAEMSILTGYSAGGNNRYKVEEMRKIFYSALKTARTKEEFLSLMHPYLFADLVSGDTTYRLETGFKEKYEKREFTPDDFFKEDSQELRRLILRSGISIKDVKSRLELIDKDEEGELYRMKAKGNEEPPSPRFPFRGDREPNYLYVVCPSTGQEYLLGVPQNFTKPKDARRWTFGLEPTAEFVKEA